jgi:hypothetical protein
MQSATWKTAGNLPAEAETVSMVAKTLLPGAGNSRSILLAFLSRHQRISAFLGRPHDPCDRAG